MILALIILAIFIALTLTIPKGGKGVKTTTVTLYGVTVQSFTATGSACYNAGLVALSSNASAFEVAHEIGHAKYRHMELARVMMSMFLGTVIGWFLDLNDGAVVVGIFVGMYLARAAMEVHADYFAWVRVGMSPQHVIRLARTVAGVQANNSWKTFAVHGYPTLRFRAKLIGAYNRYL